jgi:hypothetical protein
MIRTVGSGSGLIDSPSTAMGTYTGKGDFLLVEIMVVNLEYLLACVIMTKIQKVRPIFDPVSLSHILG